MRKKKKKNRQKAREIPTITIVDAYKRDIPRSLSLSNTMETRALAEAYSKKGEPREGGL